MRLRWRNVAILAAVGCLIWVWYCPPGQLAGILVPDHIDRDRPVGDPTAFWIVVLGALGGLLLIAIDRDGEKR